MFEQVRDIMTLGVLTRPHDAALREIFDLMAREKFSQVPITEPGDSSMVLGLINERSVFSYLSGEADTVESLLQPAPPRVSPTTYVDEELGRKLEEHDLVLVHDADHLVGIVTNSNLNKLIDHLEPYRIFPRLEQHLRKIVAYLLSQPKAGWLLRRVVRPAVAARISAIKKHRTPETLEDTYFPELIEALRSVHNRRLIERRLKRHVPEDDFVDMLSDLEAIRGVRRDLAHSRPITVDALGKLRSAGVRVRGISSKLHTGV